VLAFVALREGCVAGEEELREHARRRLVDLKVPGEIVFLEKLPKGISGKVNRSALKELPLVLLCYKLLICWDIHSKSGIVKKG
jgi:acyl-coenzyme A synthetase/AMP-(fatty) acid ligase